MLLVLGSCTSFQFGAALATHLFPVTGAVGATLLRLGLAAIVLLAITRPNVRGWNRAQWRSVILYGVSLAGMNGFYYAALARLPLSAAVTIQFLGPLTLAAALSRRWRDGGWIVLALLGVLTLGVADRQRGSGGGLDPLGVALALVSAAFWALYIIAGSRASAAVPGRSGVAVAMTAGALVLLPFGTIGAWHAVGRPGPMLLALGVALLASVVPYTLDFAAMRRAPPGGCSASCSASTPPSRRWPAGCCSASAAPRSRSRRSASSSPRASARRCWLRRKEDPKFFTPNGPGRLSHVHDRGPAAGSHSRLKPLILGPRTFHREATGRTMRACAAAGRAGDCAPPARVPPAGR